MGSLVHAKLPRAGLGNKLLVWARAQVFGARNNLPVVTTGWAEVKIGPWIRRERVKRHYFGYFRRDHPLELLNLAYAYVVSDRIREPGLNVVEAPSDRSLYVFSDVPQYSDYFDGIRDCENLIKPAFWSIASKSVVNDALKRPPPVIGVHIRRSDFRDHVVGEIQGLKANVRTPIDYFVQSIKWVRHIHGENLPITIFSDAYPEEVRDVLDLGNAVLSASRNALYDLILLSRSRCLILSHASTFGYWAGFLADAPIILPYSIPSPIRNMESNRRYYEGVAQDNALLVQNIRAV